MSALLLAHGEPSGDYPTARAQSVITRRSGDRRDIKTTEARRRRPVHGQSDGRQRPAFGRGVGTARNTDACCAVPFAFSRRFPECA